MSDTTKITVHFTGSVTYEAAQFDCEGAPWPLGGQTHGEAMADLVQATIVHDLMYGPDSLEPTDYVQELHDVTVTGVTEAERERLAQLEALAATAAGMVQRYTEVIAPLRDSEGSVKDAELSTYDRVRGDYEEDSWPLVQKLASQAADQAPSEELTRLQALGEKIRDLLARDERQANGDPDVDGEELNIEAWDLIKELADEF